MSARLSFRLRGVAPALPATGPFTLFFDLRPDINTGNQGDTSTQTITVNGTSLGTFTSPGGNAAGPAAWGQRSVDVTSLVSVGGTVHVTTQFSSGADTGYFRNMYIQDVNGTKFYGGYPNGFIYPDDIQQTGGSSQYTIAQGSGSPNEYSVATSTWVTPSEGTNQGHYYIPGSVFGPVRAYTDTFTRTDSTTLGPDYTVMPYPGKTVTFGTNGAEAYLASISQDGYNSVAVINTWSNQGYVEALYTGFGVNGGLIACSQTNPFGASYNVFCSENGSGLFSVYNATSSGGTGTAVTAQVSVGDRIRLEVTGTTANFYRNGTLAATRSIVVMPANATYSGIHAAGVTGARWSSLGINAPAP